MLVKIVKKALYHNVSTGAPGSVQEFPDDIAKGMIASKIAVFFEKPKVKKEEPKVDPKEEEPKEKPKRVYTRKT